MSGRFSISVDLLKEVLHMPEDTTIISCSLCPDRPEISMVVTADGIPPSDEPVDILPFVSKVSERITWHWGLDANPNPTAGPTAAERVGINLRRRRKEMGWTLQQLSDRLGGSLSVAQLSKIETGARGVQADDLEVLSRALSVSIGLMFAPPTESENP